MVKVQFSAVKMREIVHLQAGQCGNQIGAKVYTVQLLLYAGFCEEEYRVIRLKMLSTIVVGR